MLKQLLVTVLLGIAVVTGIIWLNYGTTVVLAPKYAEIRNQTFHNTQAYNDGMVNDLADLHLQYLGAKTPEQKASIRAVILQRFASYPKDRLPAELRDFYASL